MAFCTKCGTQASNEDAFCTSCGTRVNNAQEMEREKAPPMPVFTPPTPTFTPPSAPPAPRHSGPSCYHHSSDPAAGACAKCGKYICRDCCDSYQVVSGDYAGAALCYDCCSNLVSENVEKLKADKTKITVSLVATAIGVILGIILLSSAGPIGMIFGAAWFGSFWVAVKATFSAWWNDPNGRSGAGFVGAFIGVTLVAPFRTGAKIVQYIMYLTRTSNFISEDTQSLQQMRDYMEYTLTMSRNKGVDLETLMGQDSALYNNSFAQAVRNVGEDQAVANLRDSVISINERGEIIRSFAA